MVLKFCNALVRMGVEKPVKCQECEEQLTTTYCEDCKSWFCHECSTELHEDPAFQGHLTVDAEKAAFVLRSFKNPRAYTDEEIIEQLEKTRVVRIDDESNDLEETDAFLESTFQFEDDLQPSFISFLGPTGAGKSTILRIILQTLGSMDPFSLYPISGNESARSTTSDLHLYRGPFLEPARGNLQTLFFDSEGIDGTTLPIGSMVAAATASVTPNYLARRRNHVNQSYPKLVYLFSDVVCFVTQSNWREKQFLDTLIDWASQGSANIVNQGIKPKLVIIFNKIEPEDFSDYENIDGNTLAFLNSDPDRINTLYKFFTNPKVVFLPHATNLIKFSRQIDRLNQLIVEDLLSIRQRRQQSLQLLTISNFRSCFSIALNNFNNNNGFDFSSFVRNYELFNDSSKWLIQLFLKITKIYKDIEKAASIIRKKAALVPFLNAIRRNITFETGENAKLHDSWKEFAQNVVDRCIDETPCTAYDTFHCTQRGGAFIAYCQCNFKMHTAGHQSSETYTVERTWSEWWNGVPASYACRWDGAFKGPALDLNVENEALTFLHSLQFGWDKDAISHRLFHALLQDREDLLPIADSTMCYGCFLSSTTEKIDCGHSFCVECCKLMKNYYDSRCMFCDQIHYWKDTRIAGYRILSLDGGGVRSIMEIIILNKIEELLQIPIQYLFDFIIGSNTGSLIASLITITGSTSRHDILQIVKDGLEKFFIQGRRYIRLRYKYHPHEFQQWLKRTLSQVKMIDSISVSSLRLAIPSSLNKGKYSTVLFTSYDREVIEQDDPIKPLQPMDRYTVIDAIRASFASALYSRTYISNGLGFMDADYRNMNPSLLAIEETKRIYAPILKKQCDILLSIGSGVHRRRSFSDVEGYEKLSNVAKGFNDPEETWTKVHETVHEANPELEDRLFRANPILPEQIQPDHYDKISQLEMYANEYIQSNDGKYMIYEVSSRLLAGLIFMNSIKIRNNLIEINVSSRAVIPANTQLMIKRISIQIQQQEYIEPITFSSTGHLLMDFKCDIPKSVPITIDGKVKIVMEGEEFDLHISGMPKTIDDASQLIMANMKQVVIN